MKQTNLFGEKVRFWKNTSKIIKALVESSKNDDIATPPYAVYPLLPYLPKGSVIWECTGFRSNITKVLQKHDLEVIETHIDHGFNFLIDEPDFDFDVIVTNPPYSLKNEFLTRAYELKKPFAFLLPLDALVTEERVNLYVKHGLETLILDKRVQFTISNKVWFHAIWFCWQLLPEIRIFTELKKTLE